MARDSLFGERILWSGRPKVLSVPGIYQLVCGVAATLSLVTLCFAVVVQTGLHLPVSGMLIFSGWCAAVSLASFQLPLWWRSKVEYLVTEKHVIWRRGPLRRTIDRAAISYARIRWSHGGGAGDLVLVRAVPTGALRRTLSLTLYDVEAPDRLWAIVRGVAVGVTLGDGDRPLAQRLDDGERVLWTAVPLSTRWTPRRYATAAGALILVLAWLRMLASAAPTVQRVFRMHALSPMALIVLVAGLTLASCLLIAVALGVAYSACVRPRRLLRQTRYFVTEGRVLIRRAEEELHLDRSRIADVIASASDGLVDIFLVLDGPQARAYSSSGAFGGGDGTLVPVFERIQDAETVAALLKTPGASPVLRTAA